MQEESTFFFLKLLKPSKYKHIKNKKPTKLVGSVKAEGFEPSTACLEGTHRN